MHAVGHYELTYREFRTFPNSFADCHVEIIELLVQRYGCGVESSVYIEYLKAISGECLELPSECRAAVLVDR